MLARSWLSDSRGEAGGIGVATCGCIGRPTCFGHGCGWLGTGGRGIKRQEGLLGRGVRGT